MNAEVLKTRLNSLFARLNPPYGVVPEWHEAAAGEAEIRDTETRLGVCLPEDVKAAFRSFSGISHETPYLMSEHFETLRRKLAAAGCLTADDSEFQDDLVITQIKRLSEWGVADELYNPKEEYRRLPEAMAQEGGQAFYDGCTQEIIDNPAFVYIGDSYAKPCLPTWSKDRNTTAQSTTCAPTTRTSSPTKLPTATLICWNESYSRWNSRQPETQKAT